MKIIFLDIDGVLTTKSTGWKGFHPECLNALKFILDKTDAQMVLSSCWRHGFIDWPTGKLIDAKDSITVIKRWFTDAGWSPELANRLISSTPDFVCRDVESPFESGHRGTEISEWLKKHPEVTAFCILDDDCDMEPHGDRHVHTHEEMGLSMENAEKAIFLLTFPGK
jgi:hypothetical protein